MAYYRSCKHCGNEEDGDTIYKCKNGHVFCQSCSVTTQWDILGSSCPICEEGGEWLGSIDNEEGDDEDDV